MRAAKHAQCSWLACLPVLIALLAWPVAASAHPLGNFTINRYSRLELGTDQVRVLYVVDMAEISAFQERQTMDTDHDGTVSADEEAAYLAGAVPALAAHLHLTLDGVPVALAPQDHTLAWLPGQGGLQTLRIEVNLAGPMPRHAAARQGAYHDDNYAGRIGWQEIVVHASDGADLLSTTALTHEASQQLRAYPQDMLQSPLAMHEATFSFAPAGAGAGGAPAPSGSAVVARGAIGIGGRAGDAFTGLIDVVPLGVGGLLLAFLAAFGWGALHALTPGHGKTVVAAYLVGSRGTTRHALFLGLTTTVTHTAGVFALGLLTLFASRFIVPEQVYPWLEVLSGLLVVAIGLSLFGQRLAGLRGGNPGTPGHSHPHCPTHDHTHAGPSFVFGHDHRHGPGHSDHAQGGPSFVFGHRRASPGHSVDGQGLVIVGPVQLNGSDQQNVPWTPAAHDTGEPAEAGRAPDRAIGTVEALPSAGSAGEHAHTHSHMPPGAHGEPITWRGLLALGVSGGLLPCPSALVVMLSAIALNRILFGLALIVVFSIGLAGVLTAIGLLFVHAGRLLSSGESRLGQRNRLRLGQARLILPVVSALVIAAAGAAITWQAMPGLLH